MTVPLRTFIMKLPDESFRMTGNYSAALLAGLGEGFDQGVILAGNDTTDQVLKYRILESYSDVEPYVKQIGDYNITNLLGRIQQISRWYLARAYTGRYIVVLKDGLHSLSVFRFVNELELREFLQGLLTMLKAFNVDPKKIIMYAPFRNDDDYSIDGMILPKLK